jgi:hypothetical protein
LLKGFWRWLRIFSLTVGLMTGPLSFVREVLVIYSPSHSQSASVFWRWVWIAFVLSSFTAWIAEYRRSESLKNELAATKARPSFIGHVYQFNIHPRTGITPPEMMQEALNIFADSHKKPRTEYELKVDCDVFIEACVVNEVSTVGTILEYELEVERDGQYMKLRNEPGFLGWNQMRTPHRVDAVTGEKVAEGIKCEEVPDLLDLTKKPMLQGHSAEGWLHFVFEQINPLTLKANPIKMKRLTAIDCYGAKHEIAKGWIGERQTAIAPDVMPA